MARILVIEDNDQVAALYADALLQEGHAVDRTMAAYGAVQRCVGTRYDLVIMDLMLQGANGAVGGLAIRGLGLSTGWEWAQAVPILVISGLQMPIDQEVYDRVGFAGQMLKPVHLHELVAEVEKQLAAAQP